MHSFRGIDSSLKEESHSRAARRARSSWGAAPSAWPARLLLLLQLKSACISVTGTVVRRAPIRRKASIPELREASYEFS